MSFPKYSDYSKSETSWSPSIPSNWKVLPAKRGFNRRKELNTGMKCGNRLSLTLNGVLPRSLDDLDGLQASEFETYQVFQKDDLVFKLIDLQNIKTSRVGLVHEEGIMSPAYIRLEPNKSLVFPRYAYWFFTDLYKREVFNKLGEGVRQTLGPEELLALPFFYPTLEEQKKIVNFLDHETLKIDKLVNEQEKLIGLLKEKRQAVITDAVTKGLNPKSSLKDSGVEWLGAIPESWSVIKLKKITSRISSGKTPSGGAEIYVDTGVIFLRSQNVYDEGLRLEDVVRIPEKIDDEMSSSRVIGGDILLNITGGSIGRSCCVPHDFESANVNQHVCAIRLRQSELVAFVELFFKSDIIKRQIDYVQNGAAREGLNFEQIGNFSICIPPPEERKLIVENVQAKIKHISELTSQINQSISLLQERRSALISAAVCGLIDVRTTNGN